MNAEKKLDPRVIRTRSVLRDSLMILIREMGYDAITVQHITDRARLNRATFYLHYRDKQDLLTQITEIDRSIEAAKLRAERARRDFTRQVDLQKTVRNWLGALKWKKSTRVSVDVDPYSFL